MSNSRMINASLKNMKFAEEIIPKGTVLYKGIRARDAKPITCTMLNDLSKFYLTRERNLAIGPYARPYMCTFKTTKQLRLFMLTQDNIRKILSTLDLDPVFKNELITITGTNITVKNQVALMEKVLGKVPGGNIGRRVWNARTRFPNAPGGRISLHNVNKRVFDKLCEFLNYLGYDGYEAPALPSPYHRTAAGNIGLFHAEIMLCDASAKLKIVSQTRKNTGITETLNLPLSNISTLQSDLPKIFRNWVRLHPFPVIFGKLYPYLTGGMAAKVILKSAGRKSARSGDFDFTVARPTFPANVEELQKDSERIQGLFESYLVQFLRDFSSFFPQYPYKIDKVLHRIRLNGPVQDKKTGRVLHQVISYNLVVNNIKLEFIDVALCTVPGINASMLSANQGFPTLKRHLLIKNISATLAKSFFSNNKFNTKRNPLTGSAKEKGLKNLRRIKNLCALNNTPSNTCKQILNLNRAVSAKNLRARIIAKRLWNSL